MFSKTFNHQTTRSQFSIILNLSGTTLIVFCSSMNGENHSRNPLLCFMLHFYSSLYPQMRVKLCFNNRYQISSVSQYTSVRKINIINLYQMLALSYTVWCIALNPVATRSCAFDRRPLRWRNISITTNTTSSTINPEN